MHKNSSKFVGKNIHKKEDWKKIYQHKHWFSPGRNVSDLHFPLHIYVFSKISTMTICYLYDQKKDII